MDPCFEFVDVEFKTNVERHSENVVASDIDESASDRTQGYIRPEDHTVVKIESTNEVCNFYSCNPSSVDPSDNIQNCKFERVEAFSEETFVGIKTESEYLRETHLHDSRYVYDFIFAWH